MLHCDNPQCVVVYDSKAGWLAAMQDRDPPEESTDPSDLRVKGNNSFRSGKLKKAVQFYSRALKHPKINLDDKVACHSNRAEANVREQQWEYAASDCEGVLKIENTHGKALFRLSKSLLHLGEAAKAAAILKSLVDQNPTECIFKDVFSDAVRLQREESGQYDLQVMRREVLSSTGSRFHADFLSDCVKIGVDIPKEGVGFYRGCLATQRLEEGELVCASKAFVFIPKVPDVSRRTNYYSKQMECGSDIDMLTQMVYLLNRRPMLGKQLYKLSSGVISLVRIHWRRFIWVDYAG